ncbi:MAG: DEAD/DEAH box helicase [Myxococcales bacterium]|nr:DEAD/DEAH box helicase [Myxococcales bacterium]
MSFDDMGLVQPLLQAIRDAGYRTPTPIQRDTIEPALARRDIVGCAQTGTGKTAAFALPVLQHIDAIADDDPKIRALVLSPTRELAAQIGESFATYGRHLEVWHTVIFGGVNEKPQIRELSKGVDVLVATPGRLLDLHGRGFVDLSAVDCLVLDEADHMLDMGFLPDVKRIIAALPPKRQNLLFSATMPPEIRALADDLLHDPVSVAVAPVSAPADNVEHRLYFVDKGNKRKLLLDLLRSERPTRTLVFSRTKHGANRVAQYLDKGGVRAVAIHGNKSQGARTRALDVFKRGSTTVLVATDIAARGIDVEGVSHVINFDLPNVAETYVHRIGRTARAGASGVALSLCDEEEREYLRDIERLMKRHLERVQEHAYPPSVPPPPPTDLEGRTRSSGARPGAGARGSAPGGARKRRPRGASRGRGRSPARR